MSCSPGSSSEAAKLLGLRLAQMALTQQPQVFGYKVWCSWCMETTDIIVSVAKIKYHLSVEELK